MLNNSCTNDGAKLVKLCEFRKEWGEVYAADRNSSSALCGDAAGKLSGNEA